MPPTESGILPVTDLHRYFADRLALILQEHHAHTTLEAQGYVANLLTLFSRTDGIELACGRKHMFKPLAMLLNEAVEQDTISKQRQTLAELGDIALFISGFFARSFSSRANNLHYYVSMGEAAYDSAAGLTRSANQQQAIYAELAAKFTHFMDALNHISEQSVALVDRDALRLYDQWFTTGSTHAANLLKQLGVVPLKPKN